MNNFTFSTNGWSISSDVANVNSSSDVITFVSHPNLSLSLTVLNKTAYPTVITWSNRVQKYYFVSGIQQIKNYVSVDSIIYFNVRASVWYNNSYDSNSYRTSDFNTSYLYEPIFYNGYLIFRPYGGSAANFSVSIVSHNPSPIDSYLVSKAASIFGNDGRVISSLEQDLYPAYSTTILKPVISNSQEWVFLINQTNLAFPNVNQMPYFTISVQTIQEFYRKGQNIAAFATLRASIETKLGTLLKTASIPLQRYGDINLADAIREVTQTPVR